MYKINEVKLYTLKFYRVSKKSVTNYKLKCYEELPEIDERCWKLSYYSKVRVVYKLCEILKKMLFVSILISAI